MRSNPLIRRGLSEAESYDYAQGVMTVKGTRNKSIALLGVLAIAFVIGWYTNMNMMMSGTGSYTVFMGVVGIVTFALAIITMFKPHLAKMTSLLYVTCEGLLLGSISLVFEAMYPGIVQNTVILTMLAVLFTLLLYKQVPTLGQKIRKGVMIATFSVAGIMLIGLFFSLFGIPFVFFGSNPLGIAFGVAVVGIAAANLIVDYDNIYRGAQGQLPKYMEWFFAFGLMVTIIWLYLELLNLLMRIISRDN